MIGIIIALWKMYSFILFGNAISPEASVVLAFAVMFELVIEVTVVVFIVHYLEERSYKK